MSSTYCHTTFSRLATCSHTFHSQFGNLTGGCDGAGGHFNPSNVSHGAPDDPVRHVGDLGNVNVTDTDNGTAKIDFSDWVIALDGPQSILGYVVLFMYVLIYIMTLWFSENQNVDDLLSSTLMQMTSDEESSRTVTRLAMLGPVWPVV